MARKATKAFTVSELTGLIKETLENNLPGRLTVAGEISDWRHHHSGHCYFSLKDAGAVLPCVMWKSSFAKVKFKPESGLAVLATGHLDVYPPHGRYQFMADRLQPAGVGALQLAFEQMVRKLEAEGLFKDKHKKPLPPYPCRICIITSESGAAVHDITDSVWNRWPCAKLFLYPASVQGEGAAKQIAAAVRHVNRRNNQFEFDVLIVGRGGGSLEDLWAFNEESLARAIFDSQIPIVSAVGHEIDVTIADMVADKRASTPTKAGVQVVPDAEEVLAELNHMGRDLTNKAMLKLRFGEQQLDELSYELAGTVKGALAVAKERLGIFFEKVLTVEPHRLIGSWRLRLSNLQNSSRSAVAQAINRRRIQLTAGANRLTGLNPKTVLKRGYSITTNKNTGRLVQAASDVEPGQILATELGDENTIESKVIKSVEYKK